MGRPTLSHMGIFVIDPGAMERFYTELFGLKRTDHGHGMLIRYELIFLSNDPTKHHQLALASGRQPGTPSTVMQISFKVEALDEIRDIRARAEDLGATDIRALDHGNAWSLYFRDPEDNTVEVYMDTSFYVPQPFAEELDLTLSDAQIAETSEQRCRVRDGFKEIDQWRADFSARLAH